MAYNLFAFFRNRYSPTSLNFQQVMDLSYSHEFSYSPFIAFYRQINLSILRYYKYKYLILGYLRFLQRRRILTQNATKVAEIQPHLQDVGDAAILRHPLF